MPLALAYRRTYDRRLPFWEETRELIAGLTMGFIMAFALVSIGKLTGQISRLLIAMTFFFSLLSLPLVRWLVKMVLFRFSAFRRRAVVLGAGTVGQELVKGIAGEPFLGYEVIGFLDDDPGKHGRYVAGKKVFGPIERVSRFVSMLGVESVFIAVPSFSAKRISEIFANLQGLVREVSIVPEFRDIGMLNADLSCLVAQKLLLIRVQNNLQSLVNRIIKRGFDLVLSLAMIPVFAPLALLIMVLIRLDSPGSPIFVQQRLGRDGKLFRLYKFRTMYENSDEILEGYFKSRPEALKEWEQYRKLRNRDPRVTRVGRFLRYTSLDELPQFINVLKGDMSLIGPRPYLLEEKEGMNGLESIILLTWPGLSGLWQVSGRNEMPFQDRLKVDAWYVLNWSLWLDITILLRTINVILRGRGAT